MKYKILLFLVTAISLLINIYFILIIMFVSKNENYNKYSKICTVPVGTPLKNIETQFQLPLPSETRAPAQTDPVWRYRYEIGKNITFGFAVDDDKKFVGGAFYSENLGIDIPNGK